MSKETTAERRALGLGHDESICTACEAGDHEDETAVMSGQRCDCPHHRPPEAQR